MKAHEKLVSFEGAAATTHLTTRKAVERNIEDAGCVLFEWRYATRTFMNAEESHGTLNEDRG